MLAHKKTSSTATALNTATTTTPPGGL